MARFKIVKKDGTATNYFWSDEDASALSSKTVYKQTAEGNIKRMTGVHFDAVSSRVVKH